MTPPRAATLLHPCEEPAQEPAPPPAPDAVRTTWLEARVRENRSVLAAARAGMRRVLDLSALPVAADRGAQVGAVLRLLVPGCTPELPGGAAQGSDLVRAALRSTDVRTRAVALDGRWWRTAAMPMVGFAADGTPLGLLPRGTGFAVYDPRTGRSRRVDDDAARAVSSEAVAVYPALPDGPTRLASLVRFSLRGARRDLLALVLAGVAASVIGVCVPVAAGSLVPRVLVPGGDDEAWWLALLLAAAGAAFALLLLVRNAAALRLQGRFQRVLEPAVWSRLLSLDAHFFSQFTTGELVQRANAVAEVRASLSGSVTSAVMGAFFTLASLAVVAVIDVRLGLLIVAGALSLTAVLVVLARRQQPFEADVSRLYGEVYGHLYGVLLGIDKIQVAGREVQAFGRWAGFFARQKSADAATLRLQAASSAVMAAAQPLLLVAVLAGVAALGWHPTTGHLVVAGVAVGQLVLVLGQLTQVASSLFNAQPVLDRLRPLLEAGRERGAGQRDPGALRGRVHLESVSFAYDVGIEPALTEVSITAEPGEMIAVVGPSGAGKSTVVRLLLGFERPAFGRVRYDDQDLADLDPRLVRRQLGVVMQHSRLVRGTLLDNLTAGAFGATEADAWRAAELAGVAATLRALPLGMHTPVGEDNQTFSGGELQRLHIARALVKRPAVLLLDEATSALDNLTQHVMAEQVAQLEPTRIVIAHRLSTVRRADRIYVLDAGRVVESGTYDELVLADGLFARLVRRQELS